MRFPSRRLFCTQVAQLEHVLPDQGSNTLFPFSKQLQAKGDRLQSRHLLFGR
ncbi:MAG: hypothetical protein HC856_00510 [Pseudanabaena sp. RU_4_16]|nr:hypothetical protein [Pseudanabaena sp. RU_4_16]